MTSSNGNGAANGNGHDGVRDGAGRFVVGHRPLPGSGRPRPIDVRAAAEEVASERGIDLRVAIGEVTLTLIELAKKGDVGAARLVLDKLADSNPLRVAISRDDSGMTDTDVVARLKMILASADAREAQMRALIGEDDGGGGGGGG